MLEIKNENSKEVTSNQNKKRVFSKERILTKLKVIKYNFLRYLCLFHLPALNIVKRKANVFVIAEFPYTNAFYKESKKSGFGIYYKNNDIIHKLDWLPKAIKVDLRYNKNFDSLNNIDFAEAVNNLIGSDIMQWINERCGVDVSGLLYSRLKFYLEEVFPETIIRIRKYVEFYDNYKINFVVSYINSRVDDFAAVAASRLAKATKSVSFFHGVDALDFKSRYFSEYCHFDYFFVSTAGEVEHIRSLAALFNDKSIKVSEYNHFRNQFPLIYSNRINKSYAERDKPVVLYVPIMKVERMNMPIEKGQSLQWDYFKGHKALIKYFASRKDFHFVCKALLVFEDRGDTIASIIKDEGAANITYSTGSLRVWLPKADRVLCDIPSTAFYECIFSGIPAMAMYRPNDQKLYEGAYSSYGLSLQPYSDVGEGIAAVEKYLNSNPDDYRVALPRNNLFIPDVLFNEK